MKPTTIRFLFPLFVLLLAASHTGAQTTSIVYDRIRAAEYLRIGTNTTQKITGFSTTIPAVPTDFTLPTTKALKDYVVASFMPLGSTAGGDLSGTYPNPTVRALQGYSISNTAPTLNKVLKWNGSAWAPADDATGSSYTAGDGIGIASNIITNTGDLSATNELNTSLTVSGGNVRLTDPGSTLTLPVTDVAPLQSLLAGAGINITGGGSAKTIVNTAPNVVQVLSIDGNDLTLSDGGGTVTLPGGGASDALGTGFTDGGGSGSIPAETIAKLTSGSFFSFQWSNDGDAVAMYDDEGSVYFVSKNGSNTTQTGNSGWTTSTPSHSISIQDIGGEGNPDDGVFTITDNTSTPLGLRYAADYSATIVTNPTSFTDVTSVNLLKQTPVSYTNSAAPNNTIFYSTTDSKLSYKDPGGTVHGLY